MIGLKSILSCLVGARLILIVHMICCNKSAPIDNFAYLLLFSILFVQYNTVKHELSFVNPVESMPMNNLLLILPISNTKDEIILSNSVPFILEENF